MSISSVLAISLLLGAALNIVRGQSFVSLNSGKSMTISNWDEGGFFWNVSAIDDNAVFMSLNGNQILWRMMPGITGVLDTVSFQKVGMAGRYLRHRSYVLHADMFVDTELNRADATFKVVDGISGEFGTKSFESVNFPNHYIFKDGSSLRLSRYQNTIWFRRSSSWHVEGDFNINC